MTTFPAVEGVEHRFVVAGGLRTHVAEAGDGPPLLLMHGWPQHWYQWRGVIDRLRGERRLIAPDLRGFGWTDAPAGPISPAVFASDAVALLDALGLDRVDVAGHDWGGYAGLLLAARHPERVRRVLALSAPHPWLRMSPRLALQAWRGWYALLVAAGLMRRDVRLASWPMRREGVAPADADVYVDRLREPARADASTRLYRSYLATVGGVIRGGPAEPRATAPVLLMIGDRDVAVAPQLAEGLERGGDEMRIELIPGAGHFVCDTHAAVVADRARAHLGT
jgi:pimeloyl-ACP methyl ester carboxylesterase